IHDLDHPGDRLPPEVSSRLLRPEPIDRAVEIRLGDPGDREQPPHEDLPGVPAQAAVDGRVIGPPRLRQIGLEPGLLHQDPALREPPGEHPQVDVAEGLSEIEGDGERLCHSAYMASISAEYIL